MCLLLPYFPSAAAFILFPRCAPCGASLANEHFSRVAVVIVVVVSVSSSGFLISFLASAAKR